MIHPGYLHHWIKKNYKQVWPKRTRPPRFLNARGIAMLGQEGFLRLGRDLVSRLGSVQQEGKGLPIQFGILDLDEVGAWVVWPAQCYSVLFSKGLLRKIQRISWELQRALPEGISVQAKKSNFFSELWCDLPQDETHFMHFGSLVAHIAFSFIVHHELAHAGLGHEGVKFLRRKVGALPEVDCIPEASLEFFDEFVGLVSAASNQSEFLISQAIETDADAHGIFYTRRLLLDQAEQLHEAEPDVGDPMHAVWRRLLRDANCTQLMLFIGVAIGLLALLPNLEADDFRQTEGRTHPPLPSRLLLALHVTGSLDGYTEKFWENRSAAITTAIIAISAFQKHEHGRGIEIRESKSTPTPHTDDPAAAVKAKWQSLAHLSIVNAFLNENDLDPYWDSLVCEVRRLAPLLAPLVRFPDFLQYTWYMPASQDPRTGPA